jgi:acetamidase/formamidase
MLQHRATTMPPSAFGLLPEIVNRDLPAPGVEVPIEPFLGPMGVTTDEPGRLDPFPPRATRR